MYWLFEQKYIWESTPAPDESGTPSCSPLLRILAFSFPGQRLWQVKLMKNMPCTCPFPFLSPRHCGCLWVLKSDRANLKCEYIKTLHLHKKFGLYCWETQQFPQPLNATPPSTWQCYFYNEPPKEETKVSRGLPEMVQILRNMFFSLCIGYYEDDFFARPSQDMTFWVLKWDLSKPSCLW